ncbi:MAG: hypothetical protein J3R72DRAFT_450858 [Linnemannia gamsii]|nr:MAG: hypothetical protein J3R72DRAFT_450858 [Linnemannia gamsii]
MTVEIAPAIQKTPRPERIDIGDGLLMRWSTIKDTNNIADCMANAFKWTPIGAPVPEDDYPAPNEWVKAAIKRLMSGNSAVMTEFDYAVVENTLAKEGENPIIACICLHGVPGFYGEKVQMQYGKPEAVCSHPDYRNKGLIRRLFTELIHPASDSRGDVIQIIPGIPHFYRQFGYEYGIGLRSTRNIDDVSTKIPANSFKDDPTAPPTTAPGGWEPFTLRTPTLDDIPYLCKLSTREAQKSQAQVGLSYNERYWRYTIHDLPQTQASPFDVTRRTCIIIDSKTGKDCGLVMGGTAPRSGLYIFTLEDGYEYREALYPVLRQFLALDDQPSAWAVKQAAEKKEVKDKEDEETKKDDVATKKDDENTLKDDSKDKESFKKENQADATTETPKSAPTPTPAPPKPMRLILDPDHPVTKLLESKSTLDDHKHVRLYTRIPSYANFILKVAPSLEHRLAHSCLAGITATYQFDFYRKVVGSAGKGLKIEFKDGKIISASDDWVPQTPEQLMLATRDRKALAKAEGRPDNKKPTVFTAQFAPLTFTRVLVGDLSIDEMIYFYSETSVEGGEDAKLMLNILFPKHKEQFQCDMFWW